MNKYTEALIEAYLKGQLGEAERLAFELDMEKDSNLSETVEKHQMMIEGIKAGARQRLKQKLQRKEANLKGQSAALNEHYTLQQLLDMFEPVPHYEYLLETENQAEFAPRAGGGVSLLSPRHNETANESLLFEFAGKTAQPLTLTIENNKEVPVFGEQLPQNITEHVVAISHFAPGRYYWKLSGAETDTLMGGFWVRKHLLQTP